MSAIDAVLSRLDHPKPTSRYRWRSRCPACAGDSRSALSIGIGDNGCVLLKCFKSGCSPDEIAGALGLDIEDLFPPKDAYASTLRRRSMLSAGQALDLLDDEANLIFIAAGNIAQGVTLTDDDRARCMVAASRISYLRAEVST